ncbi:hypothetical protein BU24DRAFT_94433 [Aaosphaeria arxii CBS 175.79]|uniref:Uncharacterized protein n=1 Tax=Aaosphaeria arxii CBS 175.79 TaxID=1450172 RepID=A0A6A5X6T8_9PLEO|nr:uncharacterized protein BU24DRAFT_94433 [Aaosphaeria arxii CBS 175.79]KAF2008630.1 hypothetical protein BU24DRAFT_94433 [Aaosphaeria arxii CBS 175.79]
MYIDRSVAFGDEPRFGPMSSLSVPGVASPTRPDASKISTYVGRNNVSSGALETLYEDARRTKDALAPVALEDPLDYEYSSVMQLPWISCEAVESSTVTPFLPQIADALDIVLTRKVLDQPQNRSQLMEVLNVTVDESFRFTYQQRFSSSTDEIINTSRPLAGRLHYLAWAGAVDLKGSARNMSDMFLHSWPLNSSVGDLNAMLDGSLTILWRPDENSDVNVTKCQMHNATVEVNVQVSRGDPTLYYSHMVELGPSLSNDKALWTANDGDPSWASLALNAWMNPLYRHIQGTAFYTRQAGSYGIYERDLIRIDDIETLAHDYALSLMSGAEQGLWYPSYVQSNFSGNRIIYHYEPVNLITAYAAMLVATAVVVVLGMLSFIRNGSVSYDNKFTTIAASMQNPEVCIILSSRLVIDSWI